MPAVMIPYEEYAKFLRADANEVLARFDRLRRRMEEVNERYADDEVEEDLREAGRIVRSRKR